MIGRVDDCSQFFLANVCPHNHFPFALKVKMNWSKNVNKERDVPWQVVLGSVEIAFCVYTSLALWLEILIGSLPYRDNTPYAFAFSDDISIPKGGKKSAKLVQHNFPKKF